MNTNVSVRTLKKHISMIEKEADNANNASLRRAYAHALTVMYRQLAEMKK